MMFCFGCVYWFHQWGIPRRMCRFYCSLRGHQRTETADSADPAFSILWTPTLPPQRYRCGGSLPLTARVCTNIVCAILVSCGRSLFRILCFDCIFRFSFVLMEDRCCLYWLNHSLRITANRDGFVLFCLYPGASQ